MYETNPTKELTLYPQPMSFQAPQAYSGPEKEITIKDLWFRLRRRLAIVYAITAACVMIAILVCILSTRRYLATGELQVQKESGAPLGLDGGSSGDSASESDSLQDAVTLQTQASILESDSLALKVIHDLKLNSTDDFQPRFNPFGWALGLISPSGPSDAQLGSAGEQDLGMSPRERTFVLAVFAKNLKVKPVVGTRLIDVSYLSSSPRLSAEVVNHLIKGLSDYNFQTRHEATARTADFLTSQLSDLRKQSEALQVKLAQSQRESGVVSLGGVDAQGREQVYSETLDKLQQATTAYTQAESNRIAKGAVYEIAKTGDPEAISGLSGSAIFTGASGSDNSLFLIQSLRVQQATQQAQLAQASAKFGPAFPRLGEMQQNLDALNNSIKTEINRIAQRAKNDYLVAQNAEKNSQAIYVDLKRQADELNDKIVAHTLLRQEADQSRTLYETLFKQLKEAGVLADFHLSNISIVDPARVPSKPTKPNIPLNLAGSLIAGLFLGCCAALLRDGLDNKIQDLSMIEAELGQMPLGILPFHKKDAASLTASSRRAALSRTPSSVSVNRNGVLEVSSAEVHDRLPETPSRHRAALPALYQPRAAYTEALRALRTALLLSRRGSPPKVILITSPLAGEGKSMLSLNLATVLAHQGKRVLLVDADLRRPTLHRTLQLFSTVGLSSFLAGEDGDQTMPTAVVPIADIPGLHVITSGPVPPFPAELLGSEQMRNAVNSWRDQFDFIVIDGAPVLPVTDSVLLSSMVDVALLVVRYKVTERQSLERGYRILQSQIGNQKIGIVVNAIEQTADTYYQYYGYSESVYHGDGRKRA